MLQATIYTDTISANAVLPRLFTGAYFNILSATGPIDVKTDSVNMKGLTAGQGFEKQPFSRLEITDASGASNTIKYVIADEGFLSGLTGAMTITSMVPVQSSSFTVTAPALTVASTQMVAANTARKYLMVVNNDPAVTLYLNFGAAAVVGAASIRVGPGGVFEMEGVQSTQAINWIGSGASSLMTVVQG